MQRAMQSIYLYEAIFLKRYYALYFCDLRYNYFSKITNKSEVIKKRMKQKNIK